MSPALRIEGARIRDIPSLYAELNRVFMRGEDWTLGESLDALDDLLYGGFGVLDGDAPIDVVWADSRIASEALGKETTRAFYQAKLARPDVYSADSARAALEALDAGTGPTYFDVVMEIFASHKNIRLTLA